MVECPSCNQEGTIQGYFALSHGNPIMDLPCYRCHGKGQIKDFEVDWIRIGNELRDLRRKNQKTFREMAKILDVPPATILSIEHGLTDPTRFISLYSNTLKNPANNPA